MGTRRDEESAKRRRNVSKRDPGGANPTAARPYVHAINVDTYGNEREKMRNRGKRGRERKREERNMKGMNQCIGVVSLLAATYSQCTLPLLSIGLSASP